MKIILFSRPAVEHSADELRELVKAAAAAGVECIFDQVLATQMTRLTGMEIAPAHHCDLAAGMCPEAEVAVSYGGDGTFLDCVRHVGRYGIPVLGINSGRLGFLANIPKEGMRQAFDDLKAGRFSTQSRSLIHAEGDFPETPEYPFAFNEFSIQRGGSTSMISVEAYIDDEMVATYWGDGVILSTPAGSTAYALSVGGPVVAPGCECFVLAPIAPHNLTMRPVVIPDGSRIIFRVRARGGYARVTLDNTDYEVADGAEFLLQKAKSAVFLVQMQNISFYDTLRNKMLWGFDRRDQKKG